MNITVTIKELRRICQKKYEEFKRGYPIWEYPWRMISIYFTKVFLLLGFTANQVSLISTIIGVLATVFLAIGPRWYAIIGALLLHLWEILDCTDGEIARYRGSSGVIGDYVDRLSNTVVEPLIFVALTIRVYYQVSNDFMILLFGFLASVATLQIKLVMYLSYASALSAFLSLGKVKKILEKMSLKDFQKSLPHLWGHFSLRYAVIQNFLPSGFITMCILLIITVINSLVPFLKINSLNLNFLHLFLMVYGLLLPLGVIGLIIVFLLGKTPQKIYHTIILKAREVAAD